MFRLLFVVIFFVLCTFSTSAKATSLQYGTALTYPVLLENGRGLPVTISHEGIVPIVLAPKWILPLAAGFGTGTDAFRPAPHVQATLTYRLSDHAVLGVTGMYRYMPHWSGVPSDAHLVNAGVAPGFFITEGVMLVLPVGLARNITLNTWSASFTSKIVLTLP